MIPGASNDDARDAGRQRSMHVDVVSIYSNLYLRA